MDTLYQQVYLRSNTMQAITNQLQFETVLVPDGEFEVVNPQSLSPNRMETVESSDIFNIAGKESIESNITDSYEEYTILPPDFLEKIIGDPSFIVENLEVGGSSAKVNNLNKNQDWTDEKAFMAVKAQVGTNNDLMIETSKESPEISSLTNLGVPESMLSDSRSRANQDSSFKSKSKVLKLQEKEKHLKENLKRVNKVFCSINKKVSKKVLNDNIKTKERLGSAMKLLASKQKVEAQKEAQSSKVSKPQKMGPDFNNTLNSLNSSDKLRNKQCSIDILKKCIIEASQTLIKTEKSLRVLGKFIHSDVLIEKQTAIKHLRNYHCTINTFRKTIKGIDRKLLTHYSDFIPKFVPVGESQCLILDPQKNKDDFVDLMLSKQNEPFEIITPAAAVKQVEERDILTDDQNGRYSSVANQPIVVSGQTKPKRKIVSDPMNGKKIKTNIIHCNWRSYLVNNSQ